MDHSRPSLRLPTDAGGDLLHRALAKSKDEGQKEQTYWQHVTAVYDAWCGLVDVHRKLIDRIATRHGLTPVRLLQSSLLTIALHDVGKLTANFQEMMRAVDESAKRKARALNYRHEIAGLWVVTRAADALGACYGPIPGAGGLETLAVAGHHKFLSDRYLFDEMHFGSTIEWEPDAASAVASAQGLAKAMFKDQGWKLRFYNDDKNLLRDLLTNKDNDHNYPFMHLGAITAKITRIAADEPKNARAFHELFTLLKGLLMTADWMASGAQGEDPFLDGERSVVRVQAGRLPDHMRDRQEKKRSENPNLPSYEGFTEFQTQCAAADGHVLGLAPTGSGKTEGALAWALRQIECGHARKILFLLPTMVTANSIHKRLNAFFGEHGHKVGLIHSTADLVRDSKDEEESESDRADVRNEVLQESHFFFPVTVGTVDQLLVPLFHAGRWPMKTFAAGHSAIIIDEVHAYDPHTLGLIVMMIRQLRCWGTRFFIMSATMPTSLREVLIEELGGSAVDETALSVIEEKTLLDKARNDWKICDTPLSEWLLEDPGTEKPRPSRQFRRLWKECNDGERPLRILIVANTVQQCQTLAKALYKFNPVCYHSKFIFKHRIAKERAINECRPSLLIATQVVEVSLDIDYDILLTECAPLDALVQRAGRVNRARLSRFGRVFVHRHESKSERVYSHPAGILNSTWELLAQNQGLLTERQLIELVDRAYQCLSLKQDQAFLSIQSTIKDLRGRLAGVLDAPRPKEDEAILKTRPDDYPQKSVIPEKYAERVKALPARKRRLYELKMPVWYTRHNLDDLDGIPICRMKYSDKYGGRFDSVPGHPEPTCEVF